MAESVYKVIAPVGTSTESWERPAPAVPWPPRWWRPIRPCPAGPLRVACRAWPNPAKNGAHQADRR